MTNITSFDKYKSKKKLKKIVEDIDSILHVISLTQKSLSYYKQYIPVQEMVSVLATNSTLLELYRKTYADKLEEATQKHSEQNKSYGQTTLRGVVER